MRKAKPMTAMVDPIFNLAVASLARVSDASKAITLHGEVSQAREALVASVVMQAVHRNLEDEDEVDA